MCSRDTSALAELLVKLTKTKNASQLHAQLSYRMKVTHLLWIHQQIILNFLSSVVCKHLQMNNKIYIN